MTRTTSTTASRSSYCTSLTEARIVVVRSVRTVTLMDEGSAFWSCGRSFLIRSTTSMTLAPGWRWMFTITAGDVLIQAAWFTFSASSTTSATSDRCMGALLR